MLGKLPVPGRPTIFITVGQGPTALAVGAGGDGLDIFTLIYPFFPLSPSLWETARYRLKHCLKELLNQPTNQDIFMEFGTNIKLNPIWKSNLLPQHFCGIMPLGICYCEKSCPLCNFRTVKDIFMKLYSNINHYQTVCRGHEL